MSGLKKGATLHHGDYIIERIIGQGGFGITYLAYDRNLDLYVAIKELFPHNFCRREDDTNRMMPGTESNAEYIEKLKSKFLKEARNIAKFNHPGIIRVMTAFEENNTAYYVMEYLDRGSLSDLLAKNDRPLPPRQAVEYIKKVAEALQYLHDKHINHLDIKPGNIMLNANNEPVLIDFGLAKRYDHSGNQTSSTLLGLSHGYAPLEQYTDGGVSNFKASTDIYSLAATLYKLLSNEEPPSAVDLVQTGLTFPATVPASLQPVITHAMRSRPEDRPATLAAFLAELNAATLVSPSAIGTTSHIEETQVTPIGGESEELPISGGTPTMVDFPEGNNDINSTPPTPPKGNNSNWKPGGVWVIIFIIILIILINLSLIKRCNGGSSYEYDSDSTIYDSMPIDSVPFEAVPAEELTAPADVYPMSDELEPK